MEYHKMSKDSLISAKRSKDTNFSMLFPIYKYNSSFLATIDIHCEALFHWYHFIL